MAKQSIFGRVSQLARANISALLDSAEDPQKMLDQMVRDYTDNIAEAEQAVAQTIGNVRMMEEDFASDRKAVAEWGRKALAASRKADEFRAEGNIEEAEKFDNLAKVAIGKQLSIEADLKATEPNLRAQQDVVERLKSGLEQMRSKLHELTSKRDELVARAKTAQATAQMQDAVKNVDLLDPTSEIGRFEEKVRREEAKVRGQAELAASSLDAQFESLEDADRQTEIEARLAELKAGAVDATTRAPELAADNDAYP